MAAQLYAGQIGQADAAYPVLMRNLLPAGLRGIMFAALFGAVMSSLDSMLNSASTILTMDVVKRHFRPTATSKQLVRTGRQATAFFVIAGCLWAPFISSFEGCIIAANVALYIIFW